MRLRLLVLAGCVVLAGAVVGVVLALTGRPAATTHAAAHRGPSAPAGALAATRLLVSAKGSTALAPALAAALPAGRPFPAGTTFTPLPGSWQRSGRYANLTGTLREPRRAPVRAEIGLVQAGRRWLVTFEASR